MKEGKIKAGKLGEYIRGRRTDLDLSLRGLASAAGVNASYLSQIENKPDIPSPSPEFLWKLYDPLQVYFCELLYHAGYLGQRKEDIEGPVSIAKGIPKVVVGVLPIYLSKVVMGIMSVSFYTSAERRFKNLLDYLLKKNDKTWNDVTSLIPGVFKAESESAYISFLYKIIIAEPLINLAKTLSFDIDEFLFLTARIPDKYLNMSYIPEFAKKLNLFKKAIEKVNIIIYSLKKKEYIEERYVENYNIGGEWSLYEYIRDELRYSSEDKIFPGTFEILIKPDGTISVNIPINDINTLEEHYADISNLIKKIKERAEN